MPIFVLLARLCWLLGLLELLVACSAHLPKMQSSLQVGHLEILTVQSPIEIPTRTPTPNDEQQRNATQKPYNTPTPDLITVVVNKTEDLPESEIWSFLIRRANGDHEKYLLPILDIPR